MGPMTWVSKYTSMAKTTKTREASVMAARKSARLASRSTVTAGPEFLPPSSLSRCSPLQPCPALVSRALFAQLSGSHSSSFITLFLLLPRPLAVSLMFVPHPAFLLLFLHPGLSFLLLFRLFLLCFPFSFSFFSYWFSFYSLNEFVLSLNVPLPT